MTNLTCVNVPYRTHKVNFHVPEIFHSLIVFKRSMMLEDLVMADASMVKGLIKRWRDGLL